MFHHDSPHNGLTGLVLAKAIGLDRAASRKANDSLPSRPRRRVTDAGHGPEQTAHRAPVPRRRSSGYQPPPPCLHLPPRTHCLTPPPFGGEVHNSPILHDQTQSLLLKLPQEVRLLIYEEVLGNRLIHIVRRNHKLGHVPCRLGGNPDSCIEVQCRGIKLPTGLFVQPGLGHGDIITLLQSCRKVYLEAIDVLYQSNTFDFDSMESLIAFSCGILPKRFDSIQKLRLDFRFNLSMYFYESSLTDWARWERTWRIIASMGSLMELHVRISWPRVDLSAGEEMTYLEPLNVVTGLKTFEVILPPLKGRGGEQSRVHPFKIIRRGQ